LVSANGQEPAALRDLIGGQLDRLPAEFVEQVLRVGRHLVPPAVHRRPPSEQWCGSHPASGKGQVG
jgi:hypothetical protein